MSRVQLALNVPDRDEAIAFYSKLFATEPAKIRDGYANFEIADPPLKLVLFEASDGADRLNHLGVEVDSPDEVQEHRGRVVDDGLGVVDDNGTCCFAEQEKFWAEAPDGTWEFYAVLADSEVRGTSVIDSEGAVSGAPVCCAG